jgi:hypothetical protein
METQIIVVFCLCADMLKSLLHHEDSQSQMSDVEVMTTAIVAMLYFRGNFPLASRYLFEHRYIPRMLSACRFNRRLHRIADLFLTLFLRLGETWKKLNEKLVYIIDSYPIVVTEGSVITIGSNAQKYITEKPFEAILPVKSAISMVCAFTFWSRSTVSPSNSFWNLERSAIPAP